MGHDPLQGHRFILIFPLPHCQTFDVCACSLPTFLKPSFVHGIRADRHAGQWLQDKCEPPVYVSDRRFMKAIQMLQVAAYADGRDSVSDACDGALLAHGSAAHALSICKGQLGDT